MVNVVIRKEMHIETLQLKKSALVLRAINHKLRQQILQLIHKNGRITVTQIYEKLNLEQSVASQHLAILRRTGFVNAEREAKFIFYSVNYNRIKEVQNYSGDILKISATENS